MLRLSYEVRTIIYQHLSPKVLSSLGKTCKILYEEIKDTFQFLFRQRTLKYPTTDHLLWSYPELYSVFPRELVKFEADPNEKVDFLTLSGKMHQLNGKLYLEGPFSVTTDRYTIKGTYDRGRLTGKYTYAGVTLQFLADQLHGLCSFFRENWTVQAYENGRRHGLETIWRYQIDLHHIPSTREEAIVLLPQPSILMDYAWHEDNQVFEREHDNHDCPSRKKVIRGNRIKKYMLVDDHYRMYKQIIFPLEGGLEVRYYYVYGHLFVGTSFRGPAEYPFLIKSGPRESCREIYYQGHKIVIYFNVEGKRDTTTIYRWDGRQGIIPVRFY